MRCGRVAAACPAVHLGCQVVGEWAPQEVNIDVEGSKPAAVIGVAIQLNCTTANISVQSMDRKPRVPLSAASASLRTSTQLDL